MEVARSHKARFWEKYANIRKTGSTTRIWTEEEYARVIALLKKEDVDPKSKDYQEKFHLRKKFQVYCCNFGLGNTVINQYHFKILKLDNVERLVQRKTNPDNQGDWKYVIDDSQLFKAIDEKHRIIGHKGRINCSI